jgi:hypothetical protein
MPYDAYRAWARAGAFVVVAAVVGAVAGVYGEPLGLRSEHLGHAGWWLAVVGCLAVELVAYWVVWPRGTYTLDRPRDPAAAVAVGVPWGVAQGVVFLALFRLGGAIVDGDAATAAVAFGLISTYQAVFHAAWWDRLVAPPHNKPEWNLRKVLLCHVPNLAVTLAFLTAYGDGAVFVTFQVVALVGSALFMRFPRPSYGADSAPVRARS